MNEYAGINIRLSREEFERLTEQAQRQLRHPRDQARLLIRIGLGLTNNEDDNGGGALDSEAQRTTTVAA